MFYSDQNNKHLKFGQCTIKNKQKTRQSTTQFLHQGLLWLRFWYLYEGSAEVPDQSKISSTASCTNPETLPRTCKASIGQRQNSNKQWVKTMTISGYSTVMMWSTVHSHCFMNWLNYLLRSSIQQNCSTLERARQAMMRTFALRPIQIFYSAHCLHPTTRVLYAFK